MSVPQWLGDVPTWIGAGGATGAAWFAYQTITSQRQQIGEQQEFILEQSRFMDEQRQNLELERAELRAAAENRRRAQAQQVARAIRRHRQPVGDQGAAYWQVVVDNTTEAPIRDVQVHFGEAYRAAEVYEVKNQHLVAPHRTWQTQLGERWVVPVPMLGAGRVVEFHSQQLPGPTVYNNRPTVLFTAATAHRIPIPMPGARKVDGSTYRSLRKARIAREDRQRRVQLALAD
ncbi:hypothetical protein ACFZCT_09075 [Streptomyces qaidamensis]|uniref:hypothetical protein n=1 Tax=Streptomyces qaidamensis TaxID=1783515 RepID=UPI0036E58FEC